MAIYFVDAGGNDANDGLDNIGVGLATATWTDATFTLTQVGHGYTFAAGDVIYISAGTGATVDVYEVASSTADTIVLVETTALWDVGNASDFAAGDLASADITSSDGALLTADAVMNAVAAGDTGYIRNDQTYGETIIIDTVGTTATAVRIVGYGTTLDDDGQIIIDAADTRANCMTDSLGSVGAYYTFENIRFIDATGIIVNLSVSATHYRNCEFSGGGSSGLNTNAAGTCCEDCLFSDLVFDGVDGAGNCLFFGCKFINCARDGIELGWGFVVNCLFVNIGGIAINFLGGNGILQAAYGNTIDGNAKNTTVGIQFPSSFWGPYAAINNIIYDCITGIKGHNNGNLRAFVRNNLMNSNTTDNNTDGYHTVPGKVTTAPQFTNEAGGDYSLGASSPARAAGFDANHVVGGTQSMDIGAQQVAAAGGASGGLLMGNKRGNKQ